MGEGCSGLQFALSWMCVDLTLFACLCYQIKSLLSFVRLYISLYLLACIASVSNRVIARKLERKQKKGSFVPLPLPSHSCFFCSCPSFLDEPCEETLATQAMYLLFLLTVTWQGWYLGLVACYPFPPWKIFKLSVSVLMKQGMY